MVQMLGQLLSWCKSRAALKSVELQGLEIWSFIWRANREGTTEFLLKLAGA